MEIKLEIYLQDLRSLILRSAGLVEDAVEIAANALLSRDPSSLNNVFKIEERVNVLNKEIDHKCFKLLARQAPVAGDLRLILTITKMNLDLERMADLACNMSHNTREYLEGMPLEVATDIPFMLTKVRDMIRQSLNAFSMRDAVLAKEVLLHDEIIDSKRDELLQVIRTKMTEMPVAIAEGLSLYTIVRQIERIGDHATNLAEEVVFLITGEDIRHIKIVDEENVNGGENGIESGDRF